METTTNTPKGMLWTGRIISILVVLFLLFDAVTKVMKTVETVQGSVQIGWPEQDIRSIGVVLLVCTILYVIPRTSVLGAILLTGHLGGATAIMVRAQTPGHPFLFPVIFGILVWAGLFFRDEKLRGIIPLRKHTD